MPVLPSVRLLGGGGQMLGRALRGPLAGGNEEAEIVTVVDTELPGFRDPAETFFNWEDVWV